MARASQPTIREAFRLFLIDKNKSRDKKRYRRIAYGTELMTYCLSHYMPRHLTAPEKQRWRAAKAAGCGDLCDFFGPGIVTHDRLDPCVYDFFRTDCSVTSMFEALELAVRAFEDWAPRKGYVRQKA